MVNWRATVVIATKDLKWYVENLFGGEKHIHTHTHPHPTLNKTGITGNPLHSVSFVHPDWFCFGDRYTRNTLLCGYRHCWGSLSMDVRSSTSMGCHSVWPYFLLPMSHNQQKSQEGKGSRSLGRNWLHNRKKLLILSFIKEPPLILLENLEKRGVGLLTLKCGIGLWSTSDTFSRILSILERHPFEICFSSSRVYFNQKLQVP